MAEVNERFYMPKKYFVMFTHSEFFGTVAKIKNFGTVVKTV